MKKIPIDINIKTLKLTPDNESGKMESELLESSAKGFMQNGRNGLSLHYTEDETSGFGGTQTTISLLPDNIVSVNRVGSLNSTMVFEAGKTHSCLYDNGVCPLELRIITSTLQNGITPLGGKLDIDYSIEIVGTTAEKSHLSLSVAPDGRYLVS